MAINPLKRFFNRLRGPDRDERKEPRAAAPSPQVEPQRHVDRAASHAARNRVRGEERQRAAALHGNGAVAPRPHVDDVTAQEIARIASIPIERANGVAPHLNNAMREAEINTPKRQAAFIAQVAHESGGFRYREEIASGAAYEGRDDLGNTQRGDGRRFKGRGYIQLTGRANYEDAGRDLRLDLVNRPELAARPEHAARIAAWYWKEHDLSARADRGDFDGITREINGGQNGRADRRRLYAAAQQVLST